VVVAQGVRNLSFYAHTLAAKIDIFGTVIKLCSISPDYCSYRKDADSSSITAERLMEAYCKYTTDRKTEEVMYS